jgi:hypothetical protein
MAQGGQKTQSYHAIYSADACMVWGIWVPEDLMTRERHALHAHIWLAAADRLSMREHCCSHLLHRSMSAV